MQPIVLDKPYQFIPPRRGRFWPAAFQLYLPHYLRDSHGIERVEWRQVERLKASLGAGHGLLLAPNHCRPCDPMVLGLLAREIGRPLFVMASRHLFEQDRFIAWLLPRVGAFSVYREGMDREALKCAIQILAQAKRPLILFPEGVISRTNDRLNNLMDGTAFIARSAAKQRAAATPPGSVVVHPVAIRYFFHGDLAATITPVLDEIAARLSWRPQRGLPLPERIARIGAALLTLKELEHLGQPQQGDTSERIAAFIDHLLVPLEKEWLKGEREDDVIARVKRLRTAILPDMIAGEITEDERARRWRQLADLYLAQQLSCYPPDYLRSRPTPERMLETVERFEEDLTDKTRVHRGLRAVIEIGEAIEVSPARERGGGGDPVMRALRDQLETMLARLAENSNEPTPTS